MALAGLYVAGEERKAEFSNNAALIDNGTAGGELRAERQLHLNLVCLRCS